MSDVVKFLLARLDEDEETARVADARHVYWHARGSAVASHIARHDPARVLAEVAAKRAIVAHLDRLFEGPEDGDERSATVMLYGATAILCAIRHLATAYADHPEYRQEWAPWAPS